MRIIFIFAFEFTKNWEKRRHFVHLVVKVENLFHEFSRKKKCKILLVYFTCFYPDPTSIFFLCFSRSCIASLALSCAAAGVCSPFGSSMFRLIGAFAAWEFYYSTFILYIYIYFFLEVHSFLFLSSARIHKRIEKPLTHLWIRAHREVAKIFPVISFPNNCLLFFLPPLPSPSLRLSVPVRWSWLWLSGRRGPPSSRLQRAFWRVSWESPTGAEPSRGLPNRCGPLLGRPTHQRKLPLYSWKYRHRCPTRHWNWKRERCWIPARRSPRLLGPTKVSHLIFRNYIF